MSGKTIKILASGGGEFDCYLAMPKTDAPVVTVNINLPGASACVSMRAECASSRLSRISNGVGGTSRDR